MITWNNVPEICHMMDVIVNFQFRLFFALFPQQSKKSKFQKNEKKPPRHIIILLMCTKNYD